MHTLRAVAIEGGGVVATDANGTQFRVEINDQLRSRLRESAGTHSASPRKLSPREIQSQIRAGMSADEVAQITGASLDYIQRYEGPVLAEREYVVESALGVPVQALTDADPEAAPPTFGTVIAERLLQLSARGTNWVSWKEQAGGWVLKLSFSADTIDHDARWRFDPKKLTLSPLNGEAVALSQQGEIGGTLLPRLRAVPSEAGSPDTSRFDSAAFELSDDHTPAAASPASAAPASESSSRPESIAYGRGKVIEPRTGAVSAQKQGGEAGETADLLEALRRRRGEREAASAEDAAHEEPRTPSNAPVRTLERRTTVEPDTQQEQRTRPTAVAQQPSAPQSETMPVRPARRGRTSMPSWDEIVFGARPDDEN